MEQNIVCYKYTNNREKTGRNLSNIPPYTLIRTEDKSALASPFPKIQDKKSPDNPLFHHQKTIKTKEHKFFFAKY